MFGICFNHRNVAFSKMDFLAAQDDVKELLDQGWRDSEHYKEARLTYKLSRHLWKFVYGEIKRTKPKNIPMANVSNLAGPIGPKFGGASPKVGEVCSKRTAENPRNVPGCKGGNSRNTGIYQKSSGSHNLPLPAVYSLC